MPVLWAIFPPIFPLVRRFILLQPFKMLHIWSPFHLYQQMTSKLVKMVPTLCLVCIFYAWVVNYRTSTLLTDQLTDGSRAYLVPVQRNTAERPTSQTRRRLCAIHSVQWNTGIAQTRSNFKAVEKEMKLLSFNRNVYMQKPYPREQFKDFLYNLSSLLFFLFFHRWLQHVSEFLRTYELYYF